MLIRMYFFIFFSLILEHVRELFHASENDNLLELEEIDLQVPEHAPPSVPVYTQINITIPCTSPQLDSLDSSPKSEYSSYSSSSGKQHSNSESTTEKIGSDIPGLTPKIKNMNLSNKQTPRINYMARLQTKETLGKNLTDSPNKVMSEIFIPINDCMNKSNSNYIDNQDNMVTISLPDNLSFANQRVFENKEKINNTNNVDAYSNQKLNKKPAICNVCKTEIIG